jgi:hypothetical protein
VFIIRRKWGTATGSRLIDVEHMVHSWTKTSSYVSADSRGRPLYLWEIRCKDGTAWEAVYEGIHDLWGPRRFTVNHCGGSRMDVC